MRIRICVLLLLLITSLAFGQDYLERGIARAKAREYREALSIFQDGLRAQPDSPELLYNAGMVAYSCEEFQLAADFWKRFRALQPESYHGFTKLIQAEQALGHGDSVSALVAELHGRWKAGKVPELSSDPFFCRFQFDFQNHHFFVMQCIEPNSEKRDHFWDLVMHNNENDQYEGFFYVMLDSAASAFAEAKTGKKSEAWFLDYRDRSGWRRPISSFGYQPDLNEVVALIKQQFTDEKSVLYQFLNIKSGSE